MSEQKAERQAVVSDEAIIRAWQRVAKKRDADGNPTGSVQEVADAVGMKIGSLTQRVAGLRKRGLPLADMPRKGRAKKDMAKLQDLLAAINDELATDEDVAEVVGPDYEDDDDDYEDVK